MLGGCMIMILTCLRALKQVFGLWVGDLGSVGHGPVLYPLYLGPVLFNGKNKK